MSPSPSFREPLVHSFKDPEAVDAALCTQVSEWLVAALAVKERATLVVSGGTTPVGFLRLLAQQALPWARVLVTLADERWVAAVDQDSNERLVRECLIDPTGAAFLSLRGHEDECSEALLRLDAQLAALGAFDVVVLGMGGDGHTASLFPKAANLAELMELENPNNCALVDPVTAPHLRITQTLSRLLSSQQVVIHITGAAKRDVLGQAWDAEGFADWPIVSVLKQSCAPVTIYTDEPLHLS